MQHASLDGERGFLNKWEMYKALCGQDIGPCILPATAPLNHQTLFSFTRKYRRVFVKPISGFGGHGIAIVEICGMENQPRYRYTVGGHKAVICQSFEELYMSVLHSHIDEPCIVQQGIPTASFRGMPFDIRVMMQRDEKAEWVYAGHLVRIADTSSFVSNVEAGAGQVAELDDVLTEVLHKQTKKVEQIREKLLVIGQTVCNVLQPYRDFQDVGIDLALEPTGMLWLIEVNADDGLCDPSYGLFAKLKNRERFEQMTKRLWLRQQP